MGYRGSEIDYKIIFPTTKGLQFTLTPTDWTTYIRVPVTIHQNPGRRTLVSEQGYNTERGIKSRSTSVVLNPGYKTPKIIDALEKTINFLELSK